MVLWGTIGVMFGYAGAAGFGEQGLILRFS